MNRDECNDTQQRITDPVCDMKTCCYYCGDHIKNIDKASLIYDDNDSISNIVCSFLCEGIPDEIKDNCSHCGSLFFDTTDTCNRCGCKENYA